MIPHNGGPDFPDHDALRLIDLLVEGELDPAARRALLLRLETEPGGWRRCALAFLEAQSWREGLGGMARSPGVSETKPHPRGSSRGMRAMGGLARAAMVLAAFALGWAARRPVEPEPSPPVVAGAPAEERPAPVSVAAQNSVAPRRAEPPAPPPPVEPTLAGLGTPKPAGPARPAPVSLLSSAIRGQLERRGYQVEQRPAVAAVQLDDGRRLAIPVEEVKIRFVGSRMY